MDRIKTLDLSKIPIRILFVVSAMSAFLIFSPIEYVAKLELIKFKQEYGMYIGIVFLAATTLLTVQIGNGILYKLKSRKNRGYYKTQIQEALSDLDFDEKAVIREFIAGASNTLKIPIDNPVVAGLIGKGVIEQIGGLGNYSRAGILFPCRLSMIARKNLHLTQLDMPQNPSEEDIKRINRNRPEWVSDVW